MIAFVRPFIRGWKAHRRQIKITRAATRVLDGLDFEQAIRTCRAFPPVTQLMVESLIRKDPPKAIFDGLRRWLELPEGMELNHSQRRQAMLIYVLEGKAADGSTV